MAILRERMEILKRFEKYGWEKNAIFIVISGGSVCHHYGLLDLTDHLTVFKLQLC